MAALVLASRPARTRLVASHPARRPSRQDRRRRGGGSTFPGVDGSLPPVEVRFPATQPNLGRLQLLFTAGDLRFPPRQLLTKTGRDPGPVCGFDDSRQLVANSMAMARPIDTPAASQYRRHVDHSAGVVGIRTIRQISSCPKPASSRRSTLARATRSSPIRILHVYM